MRPIHSLLVLVLFVSSSALFAQAEPVVPSGTENSPREAPTAPAPAATAPAAQASTQAAVDAAITQVTQAATRDAKPAEVPAASATPGDTAAAAAPVVPTTSAIESSFETLTKSVSLMQQLLFAQQEREARHFDAIKQLTFEQQEREARHYEAMIRLVAIFGGAFAGVCMIGVLAAAFLNYRALVAVQNMYGRLANGPLAPVANGMLPAPAAGSAVPGIERVQASGQRFQTRMTGLEQRLAELEHLAGRESSSAPVHENAGTEAPLSSVTATAEEAGLTEPPRQVVPRAMILVHKAQALMNLGKLGEALTTLDEASTLDGAKTEVHLARGQVLEKLGRLGDALRAYDTAVDEDVHNTSALLLKAGVLNRQERFSEALACYERALEVHRAAV